MWPGLLIRIQSESNSIKSAAWTDLKVSSSRIAHNGFKERIIYIYNSLRFRRALDIELERYRNNMTNWL